MLLTLQFELLASLLLRCHKDFRLFSLLTWELIWLLAYFLCDLYGLSIFSPPNTYSILLRPVHGVECLLQVVIFPFYNTTSIKCAEPSWHLLGHLQAATGGLPCLRIWRWLAELGRDGVIMYPAAQLVSCTVQPEANSLASCLAASPLLQSLSVQKGRQDFVNALNPYFVKKKCFSCQFSTINQIRIKLSFLFERRK